MTGFTESTHSGQPDSEQRFQFGENWTRFLDVLDEDRIHEAEHSLCTMLERGSLNGLTFLDLGCGSGLFSLAAFRLGAERVHSLDIDPGCVACVTALRSRYAATSSSWHVERASVLDRAHIRSLGEFDIVYSWGVLHHTGDMISGLENAALAVAPAGRLFIAIYNDQGRYSRRWLVLKRAYNRLPKQLRSGYVVLVMAPREVMSALRAIARLRPQQYIRLWTDYKRRRGMSRWHDMVDWVGGYPFEVATADTIFEFYRARGFNLVKLVTRQVQNEFVFERSPRPSSSSR